VQLEKVSIMGLGLLGGSLGLAIRQRKAASVVHAYVRRAASIAESQRLGVADVATQDIRAAVEGADLVVFCTPLSQMAELARKALPHLKPGAIVTDVGSVKASVVRELTPLIASAKAEFIGSHPMAGSEQSGMSAARADLFESAVCVVTPGPKTSTQAIRTAQNFWKSLGGAPMLMRPDTHDDLVGRSSHLPHVVAAGLVNYVLSPANSKEQAQLCATGFRDTTRIASGSPEMWRDIVLANRQNLSRILSVFIEDLREFQLSLDREDTAAIEEFLAKAKQRRDDWGAGAVGKTPE
jgi:prephenate dehydrogenase